MGHRAGVPACVPRLSARAPASRVVVAADGRAGRSGVAAAPDPRSRPVAPTRRRDRARARGSARADPNAAHARRPSRRCAGRARREPARLARARLARVDRRPFRWLEQSARLSCGRRAAFLRLLAGRATCSRIGARRSQRAATNRSSRRRTCSDLDIRPESLPPRHRRRRARAVGSRRAPRRAGAALSRAAVAAGPRAPRSDSRFETEGDCLALAARISPAPRVRVCVASGARVAARASTAHEVLSAVAVHDSVRRLRSGARLTPTAARYRIASGRPA